MAARCHPIVSVAAARTLTSATRTDMALAAEAQFPCHAGATSGIRLGEVVDLPVLDVLTLTIHILSAVAPFADGADADSHQLLRRQVGALLGLVECRPVLRELVAAVLGRIDAHARRIDGGGDAARVAEPGDEALSGREPLSRPLGLVAPDAGPCLELRARLVSWRVGHPIPDLARVGG